MAAGLDFADDDYDDGDENGAEIDTEKLGMTTERQREIQGSLFRMLGHDNGAPSFQHGGGQAVISDNGAEDGMAVDRA